ncbi:restriction endonuclease subunit S [Streptomyces avermitilis]|uniref:restriction endonuclease subunit S n=1 Tax=Streptomyces avermitilis TaxID=33903 RepID=UPI0033A700AB
MSKENFHPMPLLVPPLEEQRRIADFLDTETARIDTLAAAMNSQDVALKQRRLRVLDFAWEHAPGTPLARLGYLSSLVTSGSRGWGDFVSDTGSLFFRSANLYRDRVQPKLTNLAYVQIPATVSSEAQRSRIESGDVLIGITGANAGWVCMANAEVAGGHVSQHVCLVRPDRHRINGDWLAFLIASPATQSKLMGNQYGGTKTQLSLPDIRDIRIPVLPIKQQVRMASSIKRRIDAIDRQRLLRQRQLALLTERRQALITAAVTGQFDVSTASGRNVTDGVSA